ncbi:hypothetical protein VNI00_003086 [Paramarasmius palmivorus]|uniref:Cytochrome P450 n=1 Tax=Paramarasmius palmivorus TaxID=297713 RepID=A0AAW0DT72_9AGAR
MISDLGIGLLVVFVFLLLKRFLDPSALGKLRGPGRKSWFTGNLEEIFAKDGWNFTRYLEKEYGTLVKLYGLMSREFLYTSEPEILTQILVKEQDTFDETDEFVQLNQLLFGTGLLSTLGDHHRKQRRLIVPAFSTRRLREMTPIMYSITHKASSTIQAIVKRTGVSGPSEVNLLEWLGRIAAGVICETGLGHTFDTFEENQNNPYADAVKELSPSVIELAWARPLIPMLVKLGPSDLRKAIVKIIPLQSVQKLYRIVEMMHSTSTRIFEDKKKDLSNNETTLDNAKDIMSILLKQNLEVDSGERLSDTELLGQMSTLTFAATDTTSNTLARIFSLLSTHTAEQEALRREILVNAPDGDLDYEKLLSLPYLDAICRKLANVPAHPLRWQDNSQGSCDTALAARHNGNWGAAP